MTAQAKPRRRHAHAQYATKAALQRQRDVLRLVSREVSRQGRQLRRLQDRLHMAAGTDYRSPRYGQSRHRRGSRSVLAREVRRQAGRRVRRHLLRRRGAAGHVARVRRFRAEQSRGGLASALVMAALRGPIRYAQTAVTVVALATVVVILATVIIYHWWVRPALGPLADVVGPGQAYGQLREFDGLLPPDIPGTPPLIPGAPWHGVVPGSVQGGAGLPSMPGAFVPTSTSTAPVTPATAALGAIQAAGCLPESEWRQALMVIGAESGFRATVDGPVVVLRDGTRADHDGYFQVQSTHVANAEINPTPGVDNRKDPVVNVKMACALLERAGGRWDGPWLASRDRWGEYAALADAALAAGGVVPVSVAGSGSSALAPNVCGVSGGDVPKGGPEAAAWALADRARRVVTAKPEAADFYRWLHSGMRQAGLVWGTFRGALLEARPEPRVPAEAAVRPSVFAAAASCFGGQAGVGGQILQAAGPLPGVLAGTPDARAEAELSTNAALGRRAILAAFPGSEIGGWGERPNPTEHDDRDPVTGRKAARALDIMNSTDAAGMALGNRVNAWLLANWDELRIGYVIWDGRIWFDPAKPPRPYKGASPHRDHNHVTFVADGQESVVAA